VEQLLATKLFIPPVRSELVIRPRLIEQLSEGLHRKLTLISAPAGFGKTTLVIEWLNNLRLGVKTENQVENRIAWLSLDEGDSDPVRFLTYLITALSQVGGVEASFKDRIADLLQSPQTPPIEDILIALINELADSPSRIVLVLDDYHTPASSPVDDALTFLLENLPPRMHLVIVTRIDPQLPLARLRVRNQLIELRAADLRFTSSEAAEFLNQVMSLDLSEEHISALEARTEGWIAGLQLAAISMQGYEDTTSFINSFAGSHRFVLDYLIEEVLEKQSKPVQMFLMRTSILDRMTGSLCDALTGRDDGQVTLEMLDNGNLLIVPLDEERRWYRYHHLFTDLLRQRLHQTQPEQIPTLHSQASEWYEQNGFVDEAIEHALRSEDFGRAAHLIGEDIDAIWRLGEHRKLRHWLDQLPEDVLFSKPHINIFQARLQCNSGQLEAAERTLEAVERALDTDADRTPKTELQKQIAFTNSSRMKLQGRVAATRALMSSYQGDVAGIIQHAHRALEHLPQDDRIWRGLTAAVLGNVHGFKGDMTAAYEARLEALHACKAAGDIYVVMLANLQLAITLRAQGRLQRTIEICQQQMQIAIEFGLSQSRLTGYLLAIWGETLAEMNDLKGAIDRAKRGFKLTERSGDLQMIGWSFMCLIRILFSAGDLTEAEEIIQKMGSFARESYIPPWVANQMKAWQTRLWLAQHKMEAAIQWARERDLSTDSGNKPQHEINFFSLFDYVVLARIQIAQGQLHEATGLLNHLLAAAEAGGRTTKVIEIKILQALTLQSGDETDRAFLALEEALALAEPEGFIRIFVDEGSPIRALLYKVKVQSQRMKEYVRLLLAAFEDKEVHPPITSQKPLIEPLSEREIEVLQIIADGLTNQEIASRLYLSLNTVKVHTRNIYGKLDVNNRTQAVAKARDLGILTPTIPPSGYDRNTP
jgi:LuxR family maltose regulon positive regulatory protein